MRRFVIYPLLLASGCAVVFGLVSWLIRDPRTTMELLADVRSNSVRKRCQAAYELARRAASDQTVRMDPALGRSAVMAFAHEWPQDPQAAATLARVLALLTPTEAAETALLAAAGSPDPTLKIQVALSLAEVGGKRSASGLAPLLADPDPGVRKAAAFAAGRLGGEDAVTLLVPLLSDRDVDVAWNAALALAAQGSPAGTPVLRQMLDRKYLTGVFGRQRAPGGLGPGPGLLENVMINAVRAVAHMRDPAFRAILDDLRVGDESAAVRRAASIALDLMIRRR